MKHSIIATNAKPEFPKKKFSWKGSCIKNIGRHGFHK